MYFISFIGLCLFFLWLYFEFTSRFDFITGKKIYKLGIYTKE